MLIKVQILLITFLISVYSELPYSRWLTATKNSERILLLTPELLIHGVNTDSQEGNIELTYNFINLYKGIIIGKRTEAECHLYEVCQELDKVLTIGTDIGKLALLETKLKNIIQLKDTVTKKLISLEFLLKKELVTLDVLYSFENKLEKLNLIELETNLEIERLRQLPKPRNIKIERLVTHFIIYDREVEIHSANLRKSYAWAITTSGGVNVQYENKEIIINPLGQLMIHFKFGRFFQNKYNREAIIYRDDWRKENFQSYLVRIEQLKDKYKKIQVILKKRLIELEKNVTILKNRIENLNTITNIKVLNYKELLNIDLAIFLNEKNYISSLAEILMNINHL